MKSLLDIIFSREQNNDHQIYREDVEDNIQQSYNRAARCIHVIDTTSPVICSSCRQAKVVISRYTKYLDITQP